MSTPIAAYSFLSWSRQGLGIHTQDAPAGKLRGEIGVSVLLRGEKVGGGQVTETFNRNVALYGPGDVVGIDPRAIVRCEPRGSIMNFEPNYLPFVEFYDEDFLWRYTPSAPSADRKHLVPWMTLLVLEEDGEFEDLGVLPGTPLARIKLKKTPAEVLPPPEELWAWAHVHIDGTLNGIGRTDTTALGQHLGGIVAHDRDQAYSRLLCPRQLRPSVAYRAFVIPTFESGRLAGLGLDPAGAASATLSAWAENAPKEFPVYHSWRFATSTVGDFEYLVRLLKPQPANPKVGVRDVDVQDAGSGVGGIARPDLHDILRMGGALRVPFDFLPPAAKLEHEKFDTWAKPFPNAFQLELKDLLNLPDDYLKSGTGSDPIIVPPIYGRWHAAVDRLLDPPLGDPEDARVRWLHELNLDPRYRAAAGIGTNVIQKNQEDYVEAAWLQVGRVIEGNTKVRHSQVSFSATLTWTVQNIQPMLAAQSSRFLTLSAPLHARVVADGMTVGFRVQESTVPQAALSKVMRQVLRPRARIAKRIGFDATRNSDTLIDRLNAGEIVAAPPKVVPAALPTGSSVADALAPPGVPQWLLALLKRHPWVRWVPLALGVLIALLLLLFGAVVAAVIALAVGAGLTAYLAKVLRTAKDASMLIDGMLTPAMVDTLPTSTDFRIDVPGSAPAPTPGGTDSEDARRFRLALREAARVEAAEAAFAAGLPVRQPLALGRLVTQVGTALHPAKTIPAWIRQHVRIPDRVREQLVDPEGEIMVYPEIDIPMYKPLADLSSELFLPNLQLIENNSITLLETNQKFIEAYMVGVNHEFSRELLWREYPTDQRGSCFRQFWDASDCLVPGAPDITEQRERLRDITRIHTWKKPERLDDHDNRELLGDKEDEIVLVIRGELLKKYPNAIIYAHRAAWERNPDGTLNKEKPRKLKDLSDAQAASPPRDIVKTPLYDATVEPDIYFFGFDLTVEKAFNEKDPDRPDEEGPGWFFVIKERPGEPRFGLDISSKGGALNTWNELAWPDVGTAAGAVLRVGAKQDYTLQDPGGTTATSPVKKQYEEDKNFRWHKPTESAELAYILYQVPVLMAVHAAEMLPKGN